MEDLLKYLNDNNFNEILKIKDYNTIVMDGNNIIHLLSIRGNEEGLDFFIRTNVFDIYKGNNDGYNILHLLFKNGWDELSEKYYTQYPDLLYVYDRDLIPPLSYCIERYDTFIKCFNFMKSNNGDEFNNLLNNVSYYNDNIFTNIIKLCKNKDDKYYNFIKSYINLIDFDKPKISPILIYSIIHNKIDLCKYFIENKKGINSKNHTYLLPLNIACSRNNIEIVKLLLEEDSDINYGGINNEHLSLNIAINNDFIDLAIILSKYIKNYNTIDKYKNTYMHYIIDKLITYLGENNIQNIEKEKKLKHILKQFILKVNIDYPNNDGLTCRELLLEYIKLKKKQKNKDSETKKLIDTVNSIERNDDESNNDINIIENNKKFSNGLFNSDVLHNMLYCMYLLNKYDELAIPFYKFDKIKHADTINNHNIQNIRYDKYYGIIYDILDITNKYLYPMLPSLILWKDKNLNYINKDLFNIISKISNNKTKRFIMIKISLIIGVQYTHANVVLIDLKDLIIRRFEPYGISDVTDEFFLDKLILDSTSKALNKKMRYLRPGDYLEITKFQSVSNDGNNDYRKTGDPGGYCLAWCLWYIELKINNPDLDEKELILNASNKIIKHYKKTDIPYLYFIRDYSRKLNEEKDKILKKIKFNTSELYDLNYKVSNLEKIFDFMIKYFDDM